MKYFLVSAVLASCLAFAYAEIPQEKIYEEAWALMARASSTSEVLTLNLTNLAILIGLAILIIAAGAGASLLGGGAGGAIGGGFGGFGNNGNNGRSVSGEQHTIGNADIVGGLCFVEYTSGNLEKLSCMQRTACEEPKTATKYLQAGKMWHKMHKFIDMIPFNDGYVSIMNAVQDATEHSLEGGDCTIYQW